MKWTAGRALVETGKKVSKEEQCLALVMCF